MTGMTDVSRFQQEILLAIAEFEPTDAYGAPYGLAIKARLEERYGEEVNHGRLYPNLDELVEAGLIEKGQIDRRTNSYALTDDAVELLAEAGDRLHDAVDGWSEPAAVADGGGQGGE